MKQIPNYRIAPLPIQTFTHSKNQVFFGYADLSPINREESLLLATHTPLGNELPTANTPLQIGYYRLDTPEAFNVVGETLSWSWHQGCRLQWYPQSSGDCILYNTLVDGKNGCVIQNIHTKEIVKTFHRSLYAVTPDGKWGFGLNFSRLQRIRPGYGYLNMPDASQHEGCPENEGLWRVNMETGEERLLFSLQEIAALEPLKTMEGADHYFHIILSNPSSSRFIFVHGWFQGKSKATRIFTANIDGSDIHLVNGNASHCNWNGDDEVILAEYSKHHRDGAYYFLSKDRTRIANKVDITTIDGSLVADENGHPCCHPDGQHFVTDTYWDTYDDQHLLLCNPSEKNFFKLGSFHTPLQIPEQIACDLHPRLSPTGRYLCIDTAHSGKREMMVFDLQPLVEPIKL